MKSIAQTEQGENTSEEVQRVRLQIAIAKAEKAEKKARKAVKKAHKMAKRVAVLEAEMEETFGVTTDLKKKDKKLLRYLGKKAEEAQKKSKIKCDIMLALK